MKEQYQNIEYLLDVYAYNHAWKIAERFPDFPDSSRYLLEMLKERRELNVDFIFAHPRQNQEILEEYGFNLLLNPREEEQLANYIMDLEAKVRNGEIIDFVRSVSPILYRLFMRLAKQEVPDLEHFIHDVKDDNYDTWFFTKMKQSDHAIFHDYLKTRRDSKVTSKGLADFLQYSSLPDKTKRLILELRTFEKSVRNPLAHLIKPFDEEELHRTTNFSSQAFLDKIIDLAIFSGVNYYRDIFYFDKVNAIIKIGLEG